MPADHSVARHDRGDARVQAAHGILGIRVCIAVPQRGKAVATHQAFCFDLIVQIFWQRQDFTIVLPGLVNHLDGGFLLIEDRELQAALLRNRVCNLIGTRRRRSVIV